MIDTIVLTLKPNLFAITDHDKFDPSTKGLFEAPYYRLGRRANFACFQNPSKEELKKGIYKPRLTVTRRMGQNAFITTLKIEFSIPKLLFGNNFDEVEESHFAEVISILQEKLREMGVLVFRNILENAPVSAVHYSKNITLTDYSTPYGILKELAKIDLNQKLDLNQTDFRNEGHSLKFRANSFEIALYDKRKDLQKAKISEKRAIERDNVLQFELFDQWKPKAPFEVLRMEIRLNQRVKIKQILEKLHIKSDLTFSSLFNQATAQKVLLFYLTQMKSSYTLLTHRPKSIKDFIADFKINNPKTKIRKMLQMLALKKAIEEMGVREFREATKPYGRHNWDRLKNDLARYRFPECSFMPLKTMQQSLTEFKPLRLKDFDKSIC
jgi:hypothetical protein